MNLFRQLSIRSRIAAGFTVVLIFTLVVAFVGYHVAHSIMRDFERVSTVNLPSVDYVMQIDRDLQQLLVAERSMLFTEPGSERFKGFLKDYEDNYGQTETRWKKYLALPKTDKELIEIERYEAAREAWKSVSREVIEACQSGTEAGAARALELTLGLAAERFEGMRDYLDAIEEIILNHAKEDHASSEYAAMLAERLLLGLSLVTLLAGAALAWLISRDIGNSLSRVMEGIVSASQEVSEASSQISQSSQSVASSTSEQAASLEETSSSLEEVSSMTRNNAENCQRANILMEETSGIVVQANESMRELIASMEKISSRSNETQKIINTIDEIAFQTNILALNAAVEAARAGAAGAGFAVVADEVRSLAQRAAQAARSTADMIEGSIQEVQSGSRIAVNTDKSFKQVAEKSTDIGKLIAGITSASEEQSQGIEQVSRATTDMDSTVQHNAANAEESAAASQELNAQAEQMTVYVAQLEALVYGGKHVSSAPRTSDSSHLLLRA